ncbi:response regulator [Pararhizobium mangrovi]|uniref:Response regulator n=1 Tax=Pararhizobium mangrovi TaxID=2590452 RepID=A0A506UHK4_9HYPH|nr:response regulator [Pararhizobium mangrovi]TPW32790.1 response regulator [Pararhizobium mangrovi]
MQRMLIVDDSAVIRKVGKRILNGMGFLVAEASSSSTTLDLCARRLPDAIILDAGMEDAVETITRVRAMKGGEGVRIYYCLVKADLKHMMAGRRAGADDFLVKPFDRDSLAEAFGRYVEAA